MLQLGEGNVKFLPNYQQQLLLQEYSCLVAHKIVDSIHALTSTDHAKY